MEDDRRKFFLDFGEIEGIIRSQEYLTGQEELFQTTAEHLHCQGVVDFYPLSEKASYMYCRRCGLRIPYSSSVVTWAELSKVLNEKGELSWPIKLL